MSYIVYIYIYIYRMSLTYDIFEFKACNCKTLQTVSFAVDGRRKRSECNSSQSACASMPLLSVSLPVLCPAGGVYSHTHTHTACRPEHKISLWDVIHLSQRSLCLSGTKGSHRNYFDIPIISGKRKPSSGLVFN